MACLGRGPNCDLKYCSVFEHLESKHSLSFPVMPQPLLTKMLALYIVILYIGSKVVLANGSVMMLTYTLRHGHPLAVLPRGLKSIKHFVLVTFVLFVHFKSNYSS